MDEILNFLNNQWVIGIGAGILSGIFVAIISRAIFSRRDRRDQREYLQKTALANNDVLYAIRPGISEGSIPSSDIIRSIISATARKYGVDVASMYKLEEFSEELTKEVMDSSFITMTTKKEYCELLNSLKENETRLSSSTPGAEFQDLNRYQNQLIFTTSALVATLTAVSAFVFVVDDSRSIFASPINLILILLPATVAIAVSFASVIFRDIQRKRPASNRKKSELSRTELSGTSEKVEENSS